MDPGTGDPFFVEDLEASEACCRLRDQLDFFPDTLSPKGFAAQQFQLPFPVLRDAILAARLKAEASTSDTLKITVSRGSFVFGSKHNEVDLWVKVASKQQDGAADQRLSFAMPRVIAERIARLHPMRVVEGQIRLGPASTEGNELRLKLGATAIRLSVAPTDLVEFPYSAITAGSSATCDPEAIRAALIYIGGARVGDVIHISNNAAFAGSGRSLALYEDPALTGVELQIATPTAPALIRALGRMRGMVSLDVTEDAYLFRDRIVACRVPKGKASPPNVDALKALSGDCSYVTNSMALKNAAAYIEMVKSEHLKLQWPANDDGDAVNGAHLGLTGFTPGVKNTATLNLQGKFHPGSKASGNNQVTVSARDWSACVKRLPFDALCALEPLRRGSVLKLSATKGAVGFSVFLPKLIE